MQATFLKDAFSEMELILMVELLRNLTNNLGYIILIAFFVSRLGSFKKIVQKDKFKEIKILV
jgi:two-component system LytT family sensor kinase